MRCVVQESEEFKNKEERLWRDERSGRWRIRGRRSVGGGRRLVSKNKRGGKHLLMLLDLSLCLTV